MATIYLFGLPPPIYDEEKGVLGSDVSDKVHSGISDAPPET